MLAAKEWLLVFAVIVIYGAIRLLPRLLAGSGAHVSVSMARKELNRGGLLLLDVRSKSEFTTHPGHIPGAVNVPLAELRYRLDEKDFSAIHRQRPVIVVCRNASRAAFAVRLLRRHGYNDTRMLGGGMDAWEEAGYPLETGPSRYE